MTNKQTVKPCGCIITKTDDPSKVELSPCVPCGIMEAAKAMGSVGQILAAIATRLKNDATK